ncbi:hypothetical protein [Candidatus Pelagibacter sp. HIMB1517]|uniref:hypothetical protein n=1 Tax=Candidatus Pelagibacter sp. HIMB1517 TaxID=3413341 RepID=UPI003F83ED64
MISFNNSFFFDKKGLNLDKNTKYKKNIDLAISSSDKILKEFQNGSNEVLESFTENYQKKIRSIRRKISYQNKKKVVIGLGGSSSGAKALSFYINNEIIFFDNLDYNYFKNFFLENKISDYFFFVISKSGDTFETLALLNLLILESNKIKNHNIFDSILIITENRENALRSFAQKNDIQIIEHNKNIGGRFSILSETGMLPILQDDKIIVEKGSEKFIKLLNNAIDDLSPIKNAAIILTCLDEMKLNMYCNLLYNYRLKHFSYWFHQLHAESLGKHGKGMTPITSICPKDHHSMMQLYLDGPKDKFFNIFSPPDEVYYESFIKQNFVSIESYSPSELLEKQFKSVINVFYDKKIPHRVINISNHKDPLNLIELFSYFILETILLGKMIGIDPFNQPAVQLIKEKIFKK